MEQEKKRQKNLQIDWNLWCFKINEPNTKAETKPSGLAVRFPPPFFLLCFKLCLNTFAACREIEYICVVLAWVLRNRLVKKKNLEMSPGSFLVKTYQIT